MSALRGWLTPRGARRAGGGVGQVGRRRMANPDEQTPTVEGAPSEEAIQRDTRSTGPA